jgi:hypothetical protein
MFYNKAATTLDQTTLQNGVSLLTKQATSAYDNGLFGVEYAWKEMLMLRGGLYVEKNIFNATETTSPYTGPSAGFTFEVPFTEKKSTVGIDYSFRATNRFNGTHTFGLRLNL